MHHCWRYTGVYKFRLIRYNRSNYSKNNLALRHQISDRSALVFNHSLAISANKKERIEKWNIVNSDAQVGKYQQLA
jgi:hypothetical protein